LENQDSSGWWELSVCGCPLPHLHKLYEAFKFTIKTAPNGYFTKDFWDRELPSLLNWKRASALALGELPPSLSRSSDFGPNIVRSRYVPQWLVRWKPILPLVDIHQIPSSKREKEEPGPPKPFVSPADSRLPSSGLRWQ
jgi:hypothetical protein